MESVAQVEPVDAARILFEDRWLVGVVKPSGCQTHPGRGDRNRSMVEWLRGQVGVRLHAVHRLDRGTSGVLLFAKDPETTAELSLQFRHHQVEKRYLALTRGHPPEYGLLDHPVPGKSGRRVPARTAFARHCTHGRYAVVEAVPKTGRPHQIRRHLKHMSCPIIGDTRYGHGEHNRWWRNEMGLHRLALHAFRLQFVHPAGRRPWCLQAPLPADLLEPLARWSRPCLEHLPPDAVEKGFLAGPLPG